MEEHLGPQLKRAREKTGVSLRDISVATKISVSALEALERNDFSRLPGGIYSRAFVRAYADAVCLDPEATVQEFLAEVSRSEREAERVAAERPEVTQDDRAFLERQRRAVRFFQAAMALVIVATIAGAVLAWMRWATPAPNASAVVSPVAAEPAPVTGTAPPAAAAEPPLVTPAARAPAFPPALPPPAPPPVPRDPLTLEFEVTAPCLVVVFADGQVRLSKVVEVGERQQVLADREFRLRVADAGAFVWSLNGRPARMLGVAGAEKQARVTRTNYKRFLQ